MRPPPPRLDYTNAPYRQAVVDGGCPIPMKIGVIVILMSIILSLIALGRRALKPWARGRAKRPKPSPSPDAQDSEVVTAARQWLALVDAHDWAGSWAASGKQFRELNSKEQFAEGGRIGAAEIGRNTVADISLTRICPGPARWL